MHILLAEKSLLKAKELGCYLSSIEHEGPEISQEFENYIANDPSKILTRTEREIANRILSHQSNKEIAAALFRSIETIQNHRRAIKQKLGISGGKFALLN